jgi:hypothetical protein
VAEGTGVAGVNGVEVAEVLGLELVVLRLVAVWSGQLVELAV